MHRAELFVSLWKKMPQILNGSRVTTNKISARNVTMPEIYDWTKFDIYLFINARPEAVSERWITTTGLESFFIKKMEVRSLAGELRQPNERFGEGDNYQWDWFFDGQSTGKVLQVIPEKSLTFTFLKKCTVTVDCRPHDAGTMLHLRQSGMEATGGDMVNIHLDCRCGWIYFLTNLKAVLECGVDVRDKRPDTSISLEVGFVPS